MTSPERRPYPPSRTPARSARAWLGEGQKIEVTDAPTRFGNVSFRISSASRDGSIRAAIHPPKRTDPSEIVLHLRHPEGKPITRVTLNGRRWRGHTEETVSFTPTGRPVGLVVHFD